MQERWAMMIRPLGLVFGALAMIREGFEMLPRKK